MPTTIMMTATTTAIPPIAPSTPPITASTSEGEEPMKLILQQ